MGSTSAIRDKASVEAVDRKTIAQVVLYRCLNEDARYLEHYFASHRGTDETPFRESVVSGNREASFPYWEGWVNVANEWLAKNGKSNNQEEVNTILKTYGLVLPTRRQSDEWDTKGTARLITSRLETYYKDEGRQQPHDGPDAHELLTDLILCGESFPDFVLAEPPADPEVRRRLAARSPRSGERGYSFEASIPVAAFARTRTWRSVLHALASGATVLSRAAAYPTPSQFAGEQSVLHQRRKDGVDDGRAGTLGLIIELAGLRIVGRLRKRILCRRGRL